MKILGVMFFHFFQFLKYPFEIGGVFVGFVRNVAAWFLPRAAYKAYADETIKYYNELVRDFNALPDPRAEKIKRGDE